MFGQFPFRDWALLFTCSFIIAHANWPAGRPVRRVTYTLDRGQSKQYLLRADGPEVAIIQKQLNRWDKVITPTPLVMARWRRELADFYCRSAVAASPSHQNEVAQVAFEARKSATTHSDAAYWSLVREKADQWIASAEASLAATRHERGEAPVKLGPVEMSGVATSGNLLSILIGVMFATGCCLWSLTSPAIELSDEYSRAPYSDFLGSAKGSSEPILISIPAKWVRVKQPTSVKLRRLVVAVVVCSAIAIQLQAIRAM